MAESRLALIVETKGGGKLKRLQQDLTGVDKAAEKAGGSAATAGKALPAMGRGAKVAAGGVRTLGAAVQAALGPIALVAGAASALGAAFQTLAAQDFAEAKVRTLGVESDDLRKKLVALSEELKGTASVTELTAASYDVASAGFNSAAEATEVLKAAQLGAVGGFSDLNTVANATTSVLNAYGLEASEAGRLVDSFIQTQNDGKIVVAEYAAEVGKVASAAAGLKVPLEEVNAVIAQSTAAGVKAEVAFTGIKTALARLASGEANKALEPLGVSITAASLEADGLIGTLEKIKATGADTGQIFKALGTEAAPALLPVLNNLDRANELLENQKNALGVAQKANDEAADTIQGAWKRLTSAIQNAFAEQSALGELLKASLTVVAIAVEELTKAVRFLVKVFQAFAVLIKPIIDLVFRFGENIRNAIQPVYQLKEGTQDAGQAILNFASNVGVMIDRIIRAIPVVGQLYSLMKNFQLLDVEGAAAVRCI